MGAKTISSFGPFTGSDLLLAAQQRGVEITGNTLWRTADAVMLIGLASILAEHNIGGINEIAAKMKKPPIS